MSQNQRRQARCPQCGKQMEERQLAFHINDVHESVICPKCQKHVRKKNLKSHKCYKPRSITTFSGGGGPGTGKRR